jgi:ubiquinone/menaquinone biosynthesis C-methylase UbiE
VEASVTVEWGAGFHAAQGRPVDESAYGHYIGRWSRLFVPALLAAAEVTEGDRVLDVATGTGEAALMAAATVGDSGFLVGADISTAMLDAASMRLSRVPFCPVASDGEALPFRSRGFGAVVCQLGLMFFPNAMHGLTEFRRVVEPGRCAAVCVISTPDKAPMWGALAEALGRHLPDQARALHLSFALSDAERLEQLFRVAGFRDVGVQRETREGVVGSFDEYWEPIETGTGQMPQAYLSLPEASRRAVRAEVCTRLSQYESDGRLTLSVEMLIASGRA